MQLERICPAEAQPLYSLPFFSRNQKPPRSRFETLFPQSKQNFNQTGAQL